MERHELQNANQTELDEQVEIRKSELERTTLAMQETERSVSQHAAEVNNIKAQIHHLQVLTAQLQQQQQNGGGGHGQ